MGHSWGFFILVTRLLFLFCHIPFKIVSAQVSPQNPLIWQTLVTPAPNNYYDYVPNATVKYYSQDFQTVYHYNDNFGHDERILINAGDGCKIPTYDDMVYYNNGISTFIKHRNLMGLVSRGGCSWSTKINNLQNLVQQNSILGMTGILIYDNRTWPDNQVPIITSRPSSRSTPIWNSTLLTPIERNISTMEDNDVHRVKLQPFMAIYFVPRQFGLDMISKMNNNNRSQSSFNNIDGDNGNSQYVQLASLFTDIAKDDNPASSNHPNNNNNGGGNDDTSNSGQTTFDNIFGGGNRGYIAYIVAAGVAIIMAIILFRWCRKPRWSLRRNNGNNESDMENQFRMYRVERNHQQLDEPPSIPIEKLNTLCPIQPADQVMTIMKNTVCAICIDDFKPTTQLRLLPCYHGFCVGCIDVWLTKKSSLCPICKYDCSSSSSTSNSDGDLGKMTSTLGDDTTATVQPSSSTSTPVPLPLEEGLTMAEQDIGLNQTTATSRLPSYSSIRPGLESTTASTPETRTNAYS